MRPVSRRNFAAIAGPLLRDLRQFDENSPIFAR
jgi:hypothetical protein